MRELSQNDRAAVILLVFNRPAHTQRMLAAVREFRPKRLFVVADGPRAHVAEDRERCQQVRKLIAETIDWPAEVQYQLAEENLGLRRRVVSGLDWAFAQVEEAMVLEDDCVPAPGFFRFCTELLARYREEPRIGAITGDNFQPADFDPGASYYYGRYPHCWGWATWRRAWSGYDDAMSRWPALRDRGWLHELFPDAADARYWRAIFDATWSREIDSWAYAWTFACWANEFLTATPRVNLVENIGFDREATHTASARPFAGSSAARPLEFPLDAPAAIERHAAADDYTQRHVFQRERRRGFPFLSRFLPRQWLPS